MNGTAPTLIIGMHRSGTSLVARVLEDLGLFLGRRLQGDHESTFFLRLNDWLLHEAGASWDRPEGIDAVLEDQAARESIVRFLRSYIRGPRSVEYLGWSSVRLGRGFWQPPANWGWKDPRTTFTVPLWASVFPGIRLIHVVRNGVDVAESLLVREKHLRELAAGRLRSRRLLYQLRERPPQLVSSARCSDIGEAFELWKLYYDRAESEIVSAEERGMSIRYEDFAAEPIQWAARLAAHCGLDVNGAAIERATRRIDTSRSFAYLKNEVLLGRSLGEWANDLAVRGYPNTGTRTAAHPR